MKGERRYEGPKSSDLPLISPSPEERVQKICHAVLLPIANVPPNIKEGAPSCHEILAIIFFPVS